jgi:Tfp pilus assembly protein FimV
MGGFAPVKQLTEKTTMRMSLLPLTRLFQWGCTLWIALCVTGFAGHANATDSSAAAAAVAKLLALPLPGSEPAAATDGPKRATVTALRGENVDRIIRRTVRDQPFKDEFVRKAFVQLNPSVLGNNPVRVLNAGTALTVPTAQDLQALLSEQYPALGKGSTEQETTPSALQPKRRWVQFP